VAINSQNIGASLSDGDFGDVEINEIVSIAIDGVSADSVELTPRSSTQRVKKFRPADVDHGTVSVTFRNQSSLTQAYVGKTANLIISTLDASPTVYWSGCAFIQSLAWRASVGELQEYSAVFKLGAT
jgi:hypothetical protein